MTVSTSPCCTVSYCLEPQRQPPRVRKGRRFSLGPRSPETGRVRHVLRAGKVGQGEVASCTEGKMGCGAQAPRPDISGWEVARPGMGVVLEAVTSWWADMEGLRHELGWGQAGWAGVLAACSPGLEMDAIPHPTTVAWSSDSDPPSVEGGLTAALG